MAQQVKQASHMCMVQDSIDIDTLIPSSFPYHCHGTNNIYSYDSHNLSQSLLLADNEDSSAGSPNKADNKLCQLHYLPNNSQLVDLELSTL